MDWSSDEGAVELDEKICKVIPMNGPRVLHVCPNSNRSVSSTIDCGIVLVLCVTHQSSMRMSHYIGDYCNVAEELNNKGST